MTVIALTPHDFVDNRLAPGQFDAATVDVDVGLDPDLYPFLASTQTTTGGANVSGVQMPDLDKKLIAARRYGIAGGAAGGVPRPPDVPRPGHADPAAVLPRASRSCSRIGSGDPTAREIADPSGRYWDVLTWRLANGR